MAFTARNFEAALAGDEMRDWRAIYQIMGDMKHIKEEYELPIDMQELEVLAKGIRRMTDEIKDLQRLLREAYDYVDEAGAQVLASEIHRALEGKRQ